MYLSAINRHKMQLWGKINILIVCHTIFNIPVGNAQAILEADQKAIVDILNEARRSVDPTAASMREMKWSDCLAEATYEYLQQCRISKTVQEIAAANICEASDQDVGFNLAGRSETITDVISIVTDWVNEKSFYRRVSNDCERFQYCGHYLRMIFPESFLVGCITFDNQGECGGDSVGYSFACSYAKGGGINSQPYALGEKCSECIAPWDNCNDGLCTRNDGSSLFPSKTSSIIIFAIVFLFVL